ncbi:MAG: hypothetical protein JXL81_11185 [Deltaproteobacteria bacterium]|nr:hypothetical protein [Deltaproteobacteria bacterium]
MSPTDIQMDDTLSVTRVTCKKTADGWDIESQPLSRTIMRNGKEIKNPLLDLLSGFIITYKIDKDGYLKDIKGYEKVAEAARSQYPAEVVEGISSMLDIDAIKQREEAEWNGRIGDYLNKEFSIGDVWEFETPYILPNGVKLTYRVKTRFKELVMHKNIKCVLIEQAYDSTGEGISDLINDVAQSVTTAEEDNKKDMSLNESRITSLIKGKVTRLVDPATMNIYKEDAERIIHMEMDMPEAGQIPVKIIETRSYEYEY